MKHVNTAYGKNSEFQNVTADLVWFGLVYLFIHSVTHVSLDMSITDYNLFLQITIYIYNLLQHNL